MSNNAVTSTNRPNYTPYSDSIEVMRPDEEKTFDEIAAAMHRLNELMYDRYRHGIRAVHAKSHGLLRGELTIDDNLPEVLRQGLFSRAGSYPVIIRFSTNPGDILADSVSTPRGMAVKVIGVEGMPMLSGHQGQMTQDFVFVNSKVFGAPDAAHFLKMQTLIVKNANDPEIFKKAVSAGALGVNTVLGLVGAESGMLEQLGHPHTHILGETFASTAALRYGDFICKMAFTPMSESLKALTGKHVNMTFHYSALRDAVVEFFKSETAEWEVGIQLCTDLKTMPVEDPTVAWPETASPYQRVGKIRAVPQDAYSPERRVYVDEVLSFNPFHALEAHRPLGNIMRARRKAYESSSVFRHKMNGRPDLEPRGINDLPD